MSGILVGVALGAMGALLLAPKSGKRLRRDIAREGRRIKRQGEAVQDRAEAAVAELAEQVSEIKDTAKDAVARTGERAKRVARRR